MSIISKLSRNCKLQLCFAAKLNYFFMIPKINLIKVQTILIKIINFV
jgi:hypothetical protein